jgi:hypothetical protein
MDIPAFYLIVDACCFVHDILWPIPRVAPWVELLIEHCFVPADLSYKIESVRVVSLATIHVV